MENQGSTREVKPLVKVFVLTHMVLIASWSLPKPAPAVANGAIAPTAANVAMHFTDFFLVANDKLRLAPPVRYFMFSSGLWQYWDMFAPNPANLDLWWDSVVTFQSGKKLVVEYPRMKTMSIWQKYFKERYRKYLERMNTDSTDSYKRPAFAQRMALLSYKDPSDPPVRVQLRRHWRTMEGMHSPVPKEYKEFILFDYVVDQEKLQRDSRR